MGKRDEAIAAMEANKDKDDELRLVYVDMLTEWKMYDEALKVADVVDNARSCIYSYPKKILAILDLINDRDDYDHFAGWVRRLYNSSPECEKIAREVAEEILKENPSKAFRRLFERIGVM